MRAYSIDCLKLLVCACVLGCERGGPHPQRADTARSSEGETSSLSERALTKPEPSLDSGVSKQIEASSSATTDVAGRAVPVEIKSAPNPLPSPAPPAATVESPAAPGQQAYPVGLLTAGKLDDHQNLTEYIQYLTSAGVRGSNWLQGFQAGARRFVHVVDEQNRPIRNAQVRIHGNPMRDPVQFVTGSEGSVLCLDLVQRNEQPTTVHVSSGSASVTQVWEPARGSLKVVLPNAQSTPIQKLDLALVIDTTGSMGDELEYLKSEVSAIAARVHQQYPNVDQRYALVVYRDDGDAYVCRKYDFTTSLSGFVEAISAQTASGGGDYPEAVHVALEQAQTLNWRTQETARVMFLIADAPPHAQHTGRYAEMVKQLGAAGVSIFPVAASGAADEAEFIFRATAFCTLSEYLFLTDHSGVGNPHAAPHAPQYTIESLGQAMVQAIARKLEGRPLDCPDPQPTPQLSTVSPATHTASVHIASSENGSLQGGMTWLALGALLIGVKLIDAYCLRCAGE